MARNVALIAGADGVAGHATVERLFRAPETDWVRIIVTAPRLQSTYWSDPRVEFVALDFMQRAISPVKTLPATFDHITHVFLASCEHADQEEADAMFAFLMKAASEKAKGTLQRVTLQVRGKPMLGPWSPGMAKPQQTEAERRLIAAQIAIGSPILTLSLYMIIYKHLGEVPHLPDSRYVYYTFQENSDAGNLANMTVWASTAPGAKNHTLTHSNGDLFYWRYLLARVGKHYGLHVPETWASAATESIVARPYNQFQMSKWAADKQSAWEEICKERGGLPAAFTNVDWTFFDWGEAVNAEAEKIQVMEEQAYERRKTNPGEEMPRCWNLPVAANRLGWNHRGGVGRDDNVLQLYNPATCNLEVASSFYRPFPPPTNTTRRLRSNTPSTKDFTINPSTSSSKTISITGCSTDSIGCALAHTLATHPNNHHIFATARSSSKILETLSSLPNVTTLSPDVTSVELVTGAVRTVRAHTSGGVDAADGVNAGSGPGPGPGLDIRVNNADIGYTTPLLDASINRTKGVYETNAWGVLRMVQGFAGQLVARKGRVVNTPVNRFFDVQKEVVQSAQRGGNVLNIDDVPVIFRF
ncbi:hypothetical protein BDW74DRAFT_181622 [Aspergillus multicolor]|uniref:uncharacterized protein n=1 Tax=Aspergillus multicolor TaxID=41759 RepID=UPI003CCD2B44